MKKLAFLAALSVWFALPTPAAAYVNIALGLIAPDSLQYHEYTIEPSQTLKLPLAQSQGSDYNYFTSDRAGGTLQVWADSSRAGLPFGAPGSVAWTTQINGSFPCPGGNVDSVKVTAAADTLHVTQWVTWFRP